jgi:hypothetical protein
MTAQTASLIGHATQSPRWPPATMSTQLTNPYAAKAPQSHQGTED